MTPEFLPIRFHEKEDGKKADIFAFSHRRLVNSPSKSNQTLFLMKSDFSEPYQINFQILNTFDDGQNIKVSTPHNSKKPQIHDNPSLNQSNDLRDYRLFFHQTKIRQNFFSVGT